MSSYIYLAKRSAIGSFNGTLSSLSAPDIAAQVITEMLKDTQNLKKEDIEEVYIGNVLNAGMGQAPARQAALKAGLPDSIPCTTVSKVCGSGLKSVMLADLTIRAGEADVVLAGGMENMSQSPYLLPKIRNGLRLGHGQLIDSMIKDGLWDVYNDYHMGNAAELCAEKYSISREKQDAYAKMSYERAINANANGLFKDEIATVRAKSRKEELLFEHDEELQKVNFDKFPNLKPAFTSNGTITAANASSLSDGASMTLLLSEEKVKENDLQPMARIVAQAQAAQKPEWFSTAPAASIKKLLTKASLKVQDIDFWEINEAFSSVAIANRMLLEIDLSKLNVRGGAVAMGHPIGASGNRVLVTLLHTLKQEKKKYGVASLCIGGGEAVSVLVENLHV
ncbi:thiolase family protein [bacterium]|nr:thiolase family protein [bacterium]